MSRIGKQPIVVPAGVTVTNNNNLVTVKGAKGELTKQFSTWGNATEYKIWL